jgi:hypothetical protein
MALNEAAAANERAKGFEAQITDANARTKAAEALAKGFDAQIADSNARAKAAEAQVASANATAAEARSMAEAERLERVRLEAVVAPRTLTIDQQRRMAAALRRFAGHAPVSVSSYGLDAEGAALGQQIIAVLRTAGLQVIDYRADRLVSGGFEVGIHIRGPSLENDFMAALRGALSSIGALQEVSINGPSLRSSGMSGGTTLAGGGSVSGGGGVVNTPPPADGPVTIMVAVKPLQVVTVVP